MEIFFYIPLFSFCCKNCLYFVYSFIMHNTDRLELRWLREKGRKILSSFDWIIYQGITLQEISNKMLKLLWISYWRFLSIFMLSIYCNFWQVSSSPYCCLSVSQKYENIRQNASAQLHQITSRKKINPLKNVHRICKISNQMHSLSISKVHKTLY